MSRLATAFGPAVRPRLVTYVTAGDPDLARSREVIRAAARGGADVIEVGVPFSDPLADGPAIQRASERALAAGSTLDTTLEMVTDVRAEVTTPIVVFTYVNPVLRLGVDTFAARAADAGVDGVLLLDLPIEESEDMRATLERRGIDRDLSRQSDDDRRQTARGGAPRTRVPLRDFTPGGDRGA